MMQGMKYKILPKFSKYKGKKFPQYMGPKKRSLSPVKKGKELFLSHLGAGEFFDRVIHYCFALVMTTDMETAKH